MWKYLLIGIITFLQGNNVDAFNKTRFESTIDQHLGYCDKNGMIELCQNSLFEDTGYMCPITYHTCNYNDIDLMQSMNTRTIPENTYYMTNIVNDGNGCKNCENEFQNIILVEKDATQNMNIDSDNLKKPACVVDNKYLNVGDTFKIENCYMCSCEKERVKCDNICRYTNLNTPMTVNNENNCLNWKQTQQASCGIIRYITEKHIEKNIHVACCKNQECRIPMCESCVTYDEYHQECEMCSDNYYTLIGYKRKCNDISRVNRMCNGFYELNEMKRQARCLTCVNGIVENNTCKCQEGYFGKECEFHYNEFYCSSNGNYNVEKKTCNCDEGFHGKYCEKVQMKGFACVNGFVKYTDDANPTCLCKKGFSGPSCNIKVACKNGRLNLNNDCMCENGYSGEICDKLGSERIVIQSTVNEDVSSKECHFGNFNDTTTECNCFYGYEGDNCDKEICENGELVFESREKTCECNSDFYGEKCEIDCNLECNGNGNNCNDDRICVCNDGWYGSKCQFIDLVDKEIINIMGKEIKIKLDQMSSVSSMKIQHIECLEENCLPFMLKNTETENRGSIRQLSSVSNNYTTMNMSQFRRDGFVIEMYSNNNTYILDDYNLAVSSENLVENNYFRYRELDENDLGYSQTNEDVSIIDDTEPTNHTTLVMGGIIACVVLAILVFTVLRKNSYRNRVIRQIERNNARVQRQNVNPNIFGHYNQFNQTQNVSNMNSNIDINPEYTKYSANPIMTNRLSRSPV